jgi:RHS repeat-associated protein
LVSNIRPNLVEKVTNGHDATTKIAYKLLTDNSVYTKENNAVYPQVDVQMPLYVVSSYKTTNGIGGENQISYHHTGAKMDLQGRGFRGFSKTTVTNETTGISNTIFYQRDYRYLSTKVKRTEQRLADGTLIAETDNTSELKDYGNGVHFSRVKQSIEKKYEATGSLKGQLITTTITSNQFDDYGNPTRIDVDHGNDYAETTVNTYNNDTTKWILGRLTTAVVTKMSPGQSAETRTSAFEYDTESGLLVKEIIEPEHATLRLEKTYQHDAYGNIQVSTITGSGIETRSHTTEYDGKGRFVEKSINAPGHSETKAYNMGNLISLTGPNELTTSWQYDGFGRPLLETRADQTQTRTAYQLCDATCPPLAKYFVRTETSGAAPIITYYDMLDREIRRQTVGFDGRAIYLDKQYNVRGEVIHVSDPYFIGETPLWTVNEYDVISRPIKETAPGNRVSTTIYQGLTTVITNPLGQKNTRTVNVIGQLIKSVDNLNNAISYAYDGFGNLIELRDPAGNTTTMQYDIRGHKTSMYDADTGQTTYTYNALGELVAQTDANGQTVQMVYDELGRITKRQEPEGVSTWEYDTQPKGIGKLAMVKGPNGYEETYRYDNFGRLIETQTTLQGQSYFVSKTYDQYGRADSLTYPTGFAVQNTYNNNGYLTEVRHANDNKLYWQAKRMNARGQLEQQAFGNGLTTDKVYDPSTGRLQRIQTGSGVVQNLTFVFDKLGNLTQRTNRHINETFQYDGLNRLTQTAVQNVYNTFITYDALGNITLKSDVGTYTYDKAKPHAVTAVNGLVNTQYGYDANGNRTSSSTVGQAIEYTSFNKPRRITQGTTTLEFEHSPTYSRYEQKVTKNGLATTTTYIGGGVFEHELSQSWTKDIHYIFAGGKSIAVYTEKNHGVAQETRYLHKDHLDSTDAITDDKGQIVEKFSFDAWGKRRNAEDWNTLTEAQRNQLINKTFTTSRGFTGHEHLDEVQLVHLNGRVYDPVIGRFLSADPFVQAPTFSQSLNRYSYVMNNPLSLVDPSGFWSLGKALKKAWRGVKKAVKKYWKPVVAAVAGIALSVVTGGLASGFLGAVLSGAGFGFGSAFTGTLLNGGRFGDALKAGLKGAVIGGAVAGVAYGVGQVIGGVSQGFKDWKHGKIGIYDVGPDGIPHPTNFIRDKIFVNGMQNKVAAAAQRGLEQYGGQSFTLVHNPSSGFIADLTESVLGKLVGPSNVSKELAHFLGANSGVIRELTVHSQAGIIAKNAFGILAGKGVKLHNLTVNWNGVAINKITAAASAKAVGANMGAFNAHFLDLVPNVVGLNGINGRIPVLSLLSIPASIIAAPTLAMPKISPHTVYP